jgi:hypothetical protein
VRFALLSALRFKGKAARIEAVRRAVSEKSGGKAANWSALIGYAMLAGGQRAGNTARHLKTGALLKFVAALRELGRHEGTFEKCKASIAPIFSPVNEGMLDDRAKANTDFSIAGRPCIRAAFRALDDRKPKRRVGTVLVVSVVEACEDFHVAPAASTGG